MSKKQNPTDRFLIMQYKEGNPSVLPTLVKRYHKVFCEKAYWITKNREMAKDIAQESWITIIDKLDTLEKIDSFKSWASRIIYTQAIDTLKIQNKDKRNLQSIENRETSTSQSEEDQKRVQKELLKAIQMLSKQKQDIIRLFYADEYSIKEISDFLNIPKGTVKSRLFKAREKLKSLIKK